MVVEGLAKIAEAVRAVGLNFSKIAGYLNIPVGTASHRLKVQIPTQRGRIRALVDYPLIGLYPSYIVADSQRSHNLASNSYVRSVEKTLSGNSWIYATAPQQMLDTLKDLTVYPVMEMHRQPKRILKSLAGQFKSWEEPNFLSGSISKPRDELDMHIVAEKEVNPFVQMSKFSTQLSVKERTLRWHYYNHVSRKILRGYEVDLPYYENSESYVYIFNYNDDKMLSKLVATLAPQPYVIKIEKVLHKPTAIIHVELPDDKEKLLFTEYLQETGNVFSVEEVINQSKFKKLNARLFDGKSWKI